MSSDAIHQRLAAMAADLEQHRTPAAVIEMISGYACEMLRADDAGVLIMHSRRRFDTPASTSAVVHQAHMLQTELGEGPCLDAIEGKATYRTGDTARDPRWPRWGPAATDLGIRSALGVRLATRTRGYGSLNIYDRGLDAFSVRDSEVAEMLAAHATAALAWSDREQGLTDALESRTVIGQAQGILMQKFDIDAEAAFSFLKRISQDENLRLVAVAEAIVQQRDANARPE
ncbi:ANTAR domain protein [Aeromicrobium marinum DSM 15272]|uniref:ANTAR domain protein n=1 Tax=Aeromicrobium marinum DSM 15272 TaxID=585531 RepID=E2S7W8_9ACTN|nr:GAF and ANTAR domain-containing protein [Aeromicrobium marinum]EFQ84784.1 ANTAR domain protein [Aeromicrobium marinum DSM 15272]